MRSLFQSRPSESAPLAEPVRTEFPQIDGAEMAAVFYGKRVAGDFYDALRVSPDRTLFGMLDVAGRREDNRGILAVAQRIFRDFGASLFAKPDSNESEAMTELCLLLNREIIEAAGNVRSCPAFLGCYHEQLGTLCYTNAGHTPGLVRDSSGTAELVATGLPLGLFSHTTCDAPTIGLEKGAILMLVSRGVIEGNSKSGRSEDLEFGMNRVKQSLQNNHSLHAEEICASILKTVCEFTSAPPVHDDVTALALVRDV
jgi:sigma-B regulation protein RsbU (phosphoserine phosphatase)